MENKFILRLKNDNNEDDKYSYYKYEGVNCDVSTPFKEKATIFTETSKVKIYTKGWKFIKIN